MKRLLLFIMILALSIPLWAGEKTVTISRNEGIYEQGSGVYYCVKGGITMTFSSGLNNVNYLVEHQQVIFDIFSTNYTIKKIVFHCLDNTTDDNLDCFYWGPSTISLYSGGGTYTYSGYNGTWEGSSNYIKFNTEAKPVRFASVDITFEKELGDIYDLVTSNEEIEDGQTYVLVSQRASKALSKEEYHGSDSYTTFSSTPVTLLNNNTKVKVTDEVQLIKLQSTGNSTRPWYLKVGDNYMRRRTTTSGSGTNTGYNLFTTSNIASGSEDYYRTSISVSGNTNNNALIRFSHNSSETSGGKTFAIRHYNGGSLFRDMDYSSNNSDAAYQRVYLYKPAQNYAITTECVPDDDSGYITLGDGVLIDNLGRQTSQQGDTVKFFVGPTDGWGIGNVTVTNLTTNEVTVLTPTSVGDFGNDYAFPMPASNVHVVANFLQPYVIHTVCTPDAGGEFNFVSGYNDFNGQTTSNEGKTVTFTVNPATNYYLSALTYTDDVTGETVTLTPDGNGVYSFVMPGNDVTLEATFLVQPNELYLLGTSMGRTSWCAAGPQFQFDGTNYYIDVYFKGGNVDGYADQAYGYFSLTKRIDQNIDWRTAGNGAGDWGVMNGMRLAATSNNYYVADGYTNVPLSGNNPDNAFKIPAGIYRITVSGDMSTMSITQTPVTLTITPPSGYKSVGTQVTLTSDVQEKVHAIAQLHGVTEDPQTIQYSLNNSNLIVGSQLTLTQEGQNTVYGQSTIGYIKATNNAVYNVVGGLYLLGYHNGSSTFKLYGDELQFDNQTECYSIKVYYKGLRDEPGVAEDMLHGYFHFSTIQDNYSSGDDVRYHYLIADSDDFPVTYYEEGGTPVMHNLHYFHLGENTNAFEIEPGIYTIYVSADKSRMWVQRHPITLDLTPEGGTAAQPLYVAYGTTVSASSDLEALVHEINHDEHDATFQMNQNNSLDWESGNTTQITQPGINLVTGQAYIGYIIAENSAYYAYTPLAYIEENDDPNTNVVVCDTLVGTWAVVKGSEKLLWAKDIGNKSIDKTHIITGEDGQKDYVRSMLAYQQHDWDQSNWVVLDFSNLEDDPHEYVGIGIDPLSIVGEYEDAVNHRITLTSKPDPMPQVEYPGYPGYVPDYREEADIDYMYNHYVMANFMPYNLNAPYGEGFVAGEGAVPSYVGTKLYFMNPKAQEVAHVMGVWNDNNQFTVYARDSHNNGFNFDGMINVDWSYNRIGQAEYDVPTLRPDTAYIFHMAIKLIDGNSGGGKITGAKPGTPSTRYIGYPLDLPAHGAIPTSVVDINTNKRVESVRYYNVMGMESREPFQGINIVVTRYSDGSVSTTKVLR